MHDFGLLEVRSNDTLLLSLPFSCVKSAVREAWSPQNATCVLKSFKIPSAAVATQVTAPDRIQDSLSGLSELEDMQMLFTARCRPLLNLIR